MALTVIAAYDVSEDPRRARLAALLQAWGERVQKSVFVLTIGPDDLAQLRTRALGIIDADTDSLYLFRQCADCWETVECVGQAQRPERTLFWAVM